MALERDGYPAAAITDGMLMVALDAALPRFRQWIAEFEGRTIRPLSLMVEVTFGSNFEWANNATRL